MRVKAAFIPNELHWLLRDFAYGNTAPRTQGQYALTATEPPAYVMGIDGYLSHIPLAAGVATWNGSTWQAAYYACRSGTTQGRFMADPGPGGICWKCEDHLAGPCVYRYFDASGRLLYVGSTSTRAIRRAYHSAKDWSADIADERYEDFDDIEDARLAEVKAIFSENPIHNRQPRGALAVAA